MTSLSVDIPVVETDRLVLREPRMADLDALAAFCASPRAKYLGGPFDRAQSWSSLIGSVGHWVLRGFGYWTMDDKASGQIAGRVGIAYHFDWPEPELGWQVFDGFEGKGLALEAATAARNHAQGVMGLGPLISLIDPDNTRSRQLAERLGAKVESSTVIRGTEALVYRHPKRAA